MKLRYHPTREYCSEKKSKATVCSIQRGISDRKTANLREICTTISFIYGMEAQVQREAEIWRENVMGLFRVLFCSTWI